MPNEELVREQVALEAITRSAGYHEVARNVCSTVREGLYVVDRRLAHLDRVAAIDAAAAAVAHHCALEGPLPLASHRVNDSARLSPN